MDPPFCILHVTTRPAGELDLARAPGPLPASTAASAIAAARRELLVEVRILLGGNRIDKRNLPAEQGKGVNGVQTRESGCGPPKRVARDRGRACLHGAV